MRRNIRRHNVNKKIKYFAHVFVCVCVDATSATESIKQASGKKKIYKKNMRKKYVPQQIFVNLFNVELGGGSACTAQTRGYKLTAPFEHTKPPRMKTTQVFAARRSSIILQFCLLSTTIW